MIVKFKIFVLSSALNESLQSLRLSPFYCAYSLKTLDFSLWINFNKVLYTLLSDEKINLTRNSSDSFTLYYHLNMINLFFILLAVRNTKIIENIDGKMFPLIKSLANF